jgi:hypothetical protein
MKKKPAKWKPGPGDSYYAIYLCQYRLSIVRRTALYVDGIEEEIKYYFRTKHEANAALKRVRAALRG